MSAHTPGPLVVEPERRQEGAPQTFRVVAVADLKANAWRKDWYAPSLLHGLSRADADLFAAAPDLLAELRKAADVLDRAVCAGFSWAKEPADAAHAAIAKAEGRS